jgi:hypothetical protein
MNDFLNLCEAGIERLIVIDLKNHSGLNSTVGTAAIDLRDKFSSPNRECPKSKRSRKAKP